MNRELPEKYIDIIQEHGWDIHYSDDTVEISQYSSAGEDFSFTVSIENFVGDVYRFAMEFEPEIHAEEWIIKKHNGAQGLPSIAELITDAYRIADNLYELYDALEICKENSEYEAPYLCGFVWKHGDKDLSAWQVQLSRKDEETIENILAKYDTCGCSLRNCYDSKFSEAF